MYWLLIFVFFGEQAKTGWFLANTQKIQESSTEQKTQTEKNELAISGILLSLLQSKQTKKREQRFFLGFLCHCTCAPRRQGFRMNGTTLVSRRTHRRTRCTECLTKKGKRRRTKDEQRTCFVLFFAKTCAKHKLPPPRSHTTTITTSNGKTAGPLRETSKKQLHSFLCVCF